MEENSLFISPSARMARNVSSAFSAFSIRSWYLEKSRLFSVQISLSILSVLTASSITSLFIFHISVEQYRRHDVEFHKDTFCL